MSIYLDAFHSSLNKHNEELCGDRVEIIRNDDSLVVVLADGLGSGVKANILSALTAKIIGTMMANNSEIDEAVETIMSTLPVCSERGIAYSTFSILQVFHDGQGYLVEFDNPPVFRYRKGTPMALNYTNREIGGKNIRECRFRVHPGDLFVLASDGVIHAGIQQTLNLGWQWNNVNEYIKKTYRSDMPIGNLARSILSTCENLYAKKPGDDTTIAVIRVKDAVQLSIMVGPPVNSANDKKHVVSFMERPGKKIICGGTTSQIIARELGREIDIDISSINPVLPPVARIDGIDLVTEGVLTLRRTLDYIKEYTSSNTMAYDGLKPVRQDGAFKLAKELLEEGTEIHFIIGRALNPAHQNPELPLNLSLKLRLVEEICEYLKRMGKRVTMEYH